MTLYTILHAKDFAAGMDRAYAGDTLAVADAILHDGYVVAGVVEAESVEDAYMRSQNDWPGAPARGWASVPTRSTSVGDVIKVGPPGVGGEFHIVAPFGFLYIGEGATDEEMVAFVESVVESIS